MDRPFKGGHEGHLMSIKDFTNLVALNGGIPPEERKKMVQEYPGLTKKEQDELIQKII